MPLRKLLAVTAIILCSALASAKKKAILPADVLRARTVLVIVDPTAGVDVRDPNANRAARADVEKALDQWGRFTLVQEGFTADLVITVRKGNGKLIQPTIGGTPINGTPPVSGGTTSTPTQITTRAAVRWAREALTIPRAPELSLPLPAANRGWLSAGYVRRLSRKHGSELVSTRCPGGVAVFRQRCARIAFGSSGRCLPQADRGVGEGTGLPSVASDPIILLRVLKGKWSHAPRCDCRF